MPHSIAFNLVCHFLYLGFWSWSAIFSKLRQKKFIFRGWLIPTISYHTNALLANPDLSYYVLLLPYWITTELLGSLLFHLFFFGVFTASSMPWKRGNIWGPCGFHFAWNFLMGNVYGFHVSGFDSESSLMYFTTSNHTLITGGEFGPEGGIPGLVVCILALLWAIFILKDTSKEQDSLYPAPLKWSIDKGTGATCRLSVLFFLGIFLKSV